MSPALPSMRPCSGAAAGLACVAVAGVSAASATTYLSVEDARMLSFPQASSFEPAPLKGAGRTRAWVARGPSGTLGYFFWDAVIGKHLLIDYSVALDANGGILRVEVLAYRESYGGQIRGEGWRRQFKGFSVQKPPQFQFDISNIGGATLSCRHVTQGVARILKLFPQAAAR